MGTQTQPTMQMYSRPLAAKVIASKQNLLSWDGDPVQYAASYDHSFFPQQKFEQARGNILPPTSSKLVTKTKNVPSVFPRKYSTISYACVQQQEDHFI